MRTGSPGERWKENCSSGMARPLPLATDAQALGAPPIKRRLWWHVAPLTILALAFLGHRLGLAHRADRRKDVGLALFVAREVLDHLGDDVACALDADSVAFA